ncbi:DUF2726 domain-containing protein [Halomonas sp. NPDC076908]|uniref:DUF2726 domain-containing protein n=1 Tax=Halomonas sp. NPDC076908 TaxID=3390567 RepID=UPI003D05E406
MGDLNILDALTPYILIIVIGILALKFLEIFIVKSTFRSFMKAFFKGLEEDDEEKASRNKKRKSKNGTNEYKKSKNKSESLSETLIKKGEAYKGNRFLMTPTERDVYKILEKGYGDKYYIFCQVRVVDIVQPNINKYQTWTKEYKSLFWQISQWHFDYVMCNKSDFSIFCALELDDASHERADRVRRDRILNAVCTDAGVDLKRMRLNHKDKKVEVIN